jgi:hypothetical protein
MQTSSTKTKKYYIYEGTPTDRDETLRFSNKREAVDYIRTQIAYKNACGENWICHLMLSKGCQFVESESRSTVRYQDAADQIVREAVAKRKFEAAMKAADAKWRDSPEDHEVWQLCCSGEQNAADTAVEHGFKGDPSSWGEYYTVAVGSIESLLSDHIEANDYRRAFFAQFNINP